MSLILGKTEKVGIKTAEGVVSERFYPIKAIADIPGAVKDAFLEHKYSLNDLSGSFIKIFTFNERELGELMNILDEIDNLDLKEVFNANLEVRYFKRKFLERVKYCVKNDIPFLNQDNTFASFLENEELFAEYTSKGNNAVREVNTVSSRVENNNYREDIKASNISSNSSNVNSFSTNETNNYPALDGEDAKVYDEIRNTLEQIKEVKQDGSIKFIIDSALSNLGDIIIRDNKQYRDAGIGSLVRKATRGVALTPEMETIINEEILVAFPDNSVGRGMNA
ncbi:MAG: hypothetical protein NC483_03300 [Ruminococcus sp.]|nr:hypothetical protein [Ruminococcus sp.]